MAIVAINVKVDIKTLNFSNQINVCDNRKVNEMKTKCGKMRYFLVEIFQTKRDFLSTLCFFILILQIKVGLLIFVIYTFVTQLGLIHIIKENAH